mmetsp:Transcript_16081/g.44715  ORF Transcript_16081/g.44715 Transcript_16081/m.44715 type:complete len:333 (+) Transcript_16081:405-1403(+)
MPRPPAASAVAKQGEDQLDSCLHRAQHAGAWKQAGQVHDRPGIATGAAQDANARGLGIAQRRLQAAAQRAIAGSCGNQAVDAAGQQRSHQPAIRAGMVHHDLDARPLIGRALDARQAQRLARRPAPEQAHPPLLDTRDQGSVARLEGIDAVTVRLAHLDGVMHPARQADDHAGGPRRQRQLHRVVKILGAVRRQRGRGAHRRRQHHRLGRCQHPVQEIGRLLERVGAVGDDDPADLGPGQMLVCRRGEALPGQEVHVLAVELGDLVRLQPAGRQRGHGAQQVVDVQLGGRVADAIIRAAGRTGDRAASAEENDERGEGLQFSGLLDENTAAG